MINKLADAATNPFGNITAPPELALFGDIETGGALGKFLTLIFQLLVVVGGLYTLFNVILAGFAFLSAGDDPKSIQNAWAKIYQSVLGISFIAGSFVLAAIFGKLIFGNYNAILNPNIPTIQDIQVQTPVQPPAQHIGPQ